MVDGVELPCTIPTYTYVGGEFLERRAKNQLRLKAVKTGIQCSVSKNESKSTLTLILTIISLAVYRSACKGRSR